MYRRKKSLALLLILTMLLQIVVPSLNVRAVTDDGSVGSILSESETDPPVEGEDISSALGTAVMPFNSVTGSAIEITYDSTRMDVSLLKSDGSPIQDNDKLSKNDTFTLKVLWHALSDDADPTYEIKPGYYYDLKIPDGLKIPNNYLTEGWKQEFYPKADKLPPGVSDSLPFAIGTLVKKGGDNYFRITFQEMGTWKYEEVEHPVLPYLTDAYAEFSFKLDETQTDDDGRLKIELDGVSVSIIVNEKVPLPPTLNKLAVDTTVRQDGTVRWKITYKNPTKGTLPNQLTDTIPNVMELMENTVNITVKPVDTSTWSHSYNSTTKVLTVPLENLKHEQELTLEYTTKLTDETIYGLWNGTTYGTATNSVKVSYESNSKDAHTASANVPINSWANNKIIDKSGVPVSGNNKRIKWTITVNTGQGNFAEFYVEDTMGDILTLVTEQGYGLNVSPGLSGTGNRVDINGQTIKIWFVKKTDSPRPALAGTYTITYYTDVDEKYFDNSSVIQPSQITNKAKLHYEFYDGKGTGNSGTTPDITKTPTINKSIITKANKGSYSRSNQALQWTVTVNPNGVDLVQVELEEDLSGISNTLKHSFYPNQGTFTNDSIQTTIRNSVIAGLKTAKFTDQQISDLNVTVTLTDEYRLNIKMGAIGTKTVNIDLTTYVKDKKFYGGNPSASRTFTNTIKLVGAKDNWDTNDGATNEGTFVNVDNNGIKTVGKVTGHTAVAEHTASSNVLKKSQLGYDPQTKRITWRLKVNENGTPLGKVEIIDTLPKHLAFVPGTLTYKNSSGQPINLTQEPVVNYVTTEGKNELQITLENVSMQIFIDFETLVKIDEDPRFKADGLVVYENIVKLKNDVNGEYTSEVKSTVTIKNTLLSKTADFNEKSETEKPDLEAKFRVELNPLSMTLPAEDSVFDLRLVDMLPDGMSLDINSIRLYEIDQSNIGKTSAGNETNGTYTPKLDESKATTVRTGLVEGVISFNPVTHELEVKIPNQTKAYVLTYAVFITKVGVKLKNNIKLLGSQIDNSNSTKNDFVKITATGGAGMRLPTRFKQQYIYIGMKKVNELNQPLPGAEFGLYISKEDSVPIGKVTVGSDGTGVLAIPRSSVGTGVEKLYWKELEAPQGYAVSPEWHEIIINQLTDDPITVQNFKTADSTKGKIKVKKTDGGTTALSGVVFELYFDSAFEMPVETGNDGIAAKRYFTNSSGEILFENLYPGATYYLKEVETKEGYILKEGPIAVEAKLVSSGEPEAYVVTNEAANVTLKVTKKDLGNNKVLPGVKFALYRVSANELIADELVAEKTTGSDGTITFTGLFPNSKYQLKETETLGGYFTLENAIDITTGVNGTTISKEINNVQKIDITVSKQWNGGSGRVPITVQLLRNNVNFMDVVLNGTESTPWTYTWEDLEHSDTNGNKYSYEVKEVSVPGYDSNVTGTAESGFVITNTYQVGKKDISAKKEWINNVALDQNLPVNLQLQRKLQGDDDAAYQNIGTEVTVGNAGNWEYKWIDQETHEFNSGKEYVYRVIETNIPLNYTVRYSTNTEGVFIITNTNSEMIQIPVTKTWDDADDQDGKRPDSVTINVLDVDSGVIVASHAIRESDDWKYTFTLYKYNQTTGKEINYQITEDSVTGYSTKIAGYNVTNSYTPGITSVTVTKLWQDSNNAPGARPKSIEVQLTADGKKLGPIVTLNGDNNWTTTWNNLPEKEKGKDIKYSVEEISKIAQYTTTINDSNHGNITITNSYNFPPYIPPVEPEPSPTPTPTPEPTPAPEPTQTPKPEKPTPTPKPEKPEPTPTPPTEKTKTPKEEPKEGEVPVPEGGKPEVKEPPKNGTVTIDEDGNWTYVPKGGFTGKDKFVITVTDKDGNEQDFVIEIDVEDIPLGNIEGDIPKTGDNTLPIVYLLAAIILLLSAIFVQKKKRDLKTE